MLWILGAVWIFGIPLVLIGVMLFCEWLCERRQLRDPLERLWDAPARIPAREQIGVLSTSGRQRQRRHGRRIV